MAEQSETRVVLGLSKILEGFEYIPGKINARIVKEYDGRDVLQIRDPAGLHQYEVDGNPLGITVDKRFESYLDYLEHILNEYISNYEASGTKRDNPGNANETKFRKSF